MEKVSKCPSRQLTDSSRPRHIPPAKLGSHLNFPATDPTRAVTVPAGSAYAYGWALKGKNQLYDLTISYGWMGRVDVVVMVLVAK